MATFVEKGLLKDLSQEDRDKAGVFERDPDMEEFFISGPAVVAGIKIQHAFECLYTRDKCREIIVWYTRQGGDLGVGQKYLRDACGLKPIGAPQNAKADDAPEPPKSVELGILPQASLGEGKDDDDKFAEVSTFAAREMNCKGIEFLTASRWQQLNMRGCDLNGLHKRTIWQSFLQSGHWRDVGRILNSATNLMPNIRFHSSPGCILAPPNTDFADAKCKEYLQQPSTDALDLVLYKEEFDVTNLQVGDTPPVWVISQLGSTPKVKVV